jgi:hypothetical protein
VIRVTIPANTLYAASASRLVSVPETIVHIDEDGSVTIDGDDKSIGRVVKGTYTYSPPMYRGNPIVRFHRQVPCWYGYRPGRHPSGLGVCGDRRTRQEVIQHLLAEYLGETERKATS